MIGNREGSAVFNMLGIFVIKICKFVYDVPLGSRLHDESEDTIACPTDSQASDKLVTERLGLSDGAETPGGHLLGVELDGVLGEVEPLLDHAGQLTDPKIYLFTH